MPLSGRSLRRFGSGDWLLFAALVICGCGCLGWRLLATAGRHEEYYTYYGQDAAGIGRPGDRSFSIRRNMDRAGIDEFFAMGKAKSGPDEHDQAGDEQYETECFLHRTNIRNFGGAGRLVVN